MVKVRRGARSVRCGNKLDNCVQSSGLWLVIGRRGGKMFADGAR